MLINSVVFNGAASTFFQQSADHQAVIETAFEDSIDGLLFKMGKVEHFRNLMNRGRLDDGKAPNYTELEALQIYKPNGGSK